MHQPRTRKHYVETPRGLIHVQSCGQGVDPALVIVTPTSFASPLLDTVLPPLARAGWQVVALDLMGYGRSDKRDGHWLVEDFAANIEHAVAALGVDPVGLVCGHFACWTGVEIAARGRWPRLRALVLDGSPWYDAGQRARMQAEGPPAPTPWDEKGSHALAYWDKVWRILHQLTPDKPLPAVPSQRFREAVMCLMEASIYEPNTAVAAARYELQARLPLVSQPTLVMCSDTDWNLPHHDRLLAALPRAEGLRLPGVNPLHDIDAPERGAEYAAHLAAWFARHRP